MFYHASRKAIQRDLSLKLSMGVEKAFESKNEGFQSLGLFLYELVHRYPPVIKEKVTNKDSNGPLGLIEVRSDISQNCRDLISWLIRPIFDERPKLEQIFAHPWMKTYESYFKITMKDYIY